MISLARLIKHNVSDLVSNKLQRLREMISTVHLNITTRESDPKFLRTLTRIIPGGDDGSGEFQAKSEAEWIASRSIFPWSLAFYKVGLSFSLLSKAKIRLLKAS